jgi:hypothetical protein
MQAHIYRGHRGYLNFYRKREEAERDPQAEFHRKAIRDE